MKLNSKALALAAGIVWGVIVFVATLWVVLIGGRGEHLRLLNMLYFGYSVSFVGSFVGLIWGFIDGVITGWVFAWLYNRLSEPAATPEPKAS